LDVLRGGGEVMDVDSLLEFVERFKQFYQEEKLVV